MARQKSGAPAPRSVPGGARRTSPIDSRVLYSQLVDHLEEHAVFVVDRHRRVAHWSLAAQRVYGYRREQILGKPVATLVPPELWPDEQKALKAIFAGKTIPPFETRRIRSDGRIIEVWITMSPVRAPGGRVVGVFKIVHDVTERKHTTDALFESERKLRALLDAAVDAVITIDERGLIESANPATEKLFGYPQSELLGKNVSMLMPQPYRREHDAYLRNYARTGHAKIIGIGREVTGQRKDGSLFPLNLSVSEVYLHNRRIFAGILHDLTERRRLEKQILEAAANEQRRIGQDLHDGLCQDLVGLAFSADFLAKQLALKSLADAKTAADISESLRHAAAQARALSHGLNPVDVKAGGLSGALHNLARKVSQSFAVHCSFHGDRLEDLSEDSAATHLYRIAQEAIGNAIKHGKARRVRISLSHHGSAIALAIDDDGLGLNKNITDQLRRGFYSPDPSSSRPASGIGLQTMNYRARVIGGTFTIEARKPRGTRVTVSLRPDLQSPR
ncbi:MAG TPA: PAS domain S-box protein [Phycisphaerae bacterium]|nr:PAS domain S-box protein [Phycisphaerae bacterium]